MAVKKEPFNGEAVLSLTIAQRDGGEAGCIMLLLVNRIGELRIEQLVGLSHSSAMNDAASSRRHYQGISRDEMLFH